MNPDRKTYIGGPDAAMICGLSPYGGAFDVWQRKMGLVGEMEDPATVIRVGSALEDLVCELYTERTGYGLRETETVIAATDTWRGGSADRIIYNGDGQYVGILEAKVTSGWKRADYGEEGTDEVPAHFLIQCAWYLKLWGLPWADLAVLFLPHTFCTFHVERNMKLETNLIERCRRFWFDHVVTGTPPEVDGSAGAGDYLQTQFPRNTLDMLSSDDAPEAEEIMRKLSFQKSALDVAERKRRHHEQQLMKIIGDHDGVQCGAGKSTWKADVNGKRRFKFTDYTD